jgi:hypothetical protein
MPIRKAGAKIFLLDFKARFCSQKPRKGATPVPVPTITMDRLTCGGKWNFGELFIQ